METQHHGSSPLEPILMIKFVVNLKPLINAYNFQNVLFYMVQINFCTSLKAYATFVPVFFYPLP